MGTETATVIQKLSGFGSKLGDFVQEERLSESNNTTAQEGFCRGVCLDWTRKVLLGGKPTYANTDRLVTQTRRQAAVQVGIERSDKAQGELADVRKELLDLYSTNDEEHLTLPQPLLTKLNKWLNLKVLPDRIYHMDVMSRVLDLLSDKMDMYNHRTETGWAALARSMDKFHLEQCQDQMREGPAKKFSHIKILVSSPEKSYGDGSAKAALSQLFQLPSFVANTVLALNFGLFQGNQPTGHGVALHKQSDGRYAFLDPNFGIFRYNDARGALGALVYLFVGSSANEAVYDEDEGQVTGRVGYIVFGRA